MKWKIMKNKTKQMEEKVHHILYLLLIEQKDSQS